MVSLYGEMQANYICTEHPIYKKRAVKIINKVLYNTHTDPLFKKSEILKLSDLYEHTATLFVNDYNMARLPHSFSDLFRFKNEVKQLLFTYAATVKCTNPFYNDCRQR